MILFTTFTLLTVRRPPSSKQTAEQNLALARASSDVAALLPASYSSAPLATAVLPLTALSEEPALSGSQQLERVARDDPDAAAPFVHLTRGLATILALWWLAFVMVPIVPCVTRASNIVKVKICYNGTVEPGADGKLYCSVPTYNDTFHGLCMGNVHSPGLLQSCCWRSQFFVTRRDCDHAGGVRLRLRHRLPHR